MKITHDDVAELRAKVDALLDDFHGFEGTWKVGQPLLNALNRAAYYLDRAAVEARILDGQRTDYGQNGGQTTDTTDNAGRKPICPSSRRTDYGQDNGQSAAIAGAVRRAPADGSPTACPGTATARSGDPSPGELPQAPLNACPARDSAYEAEGAVE